MVGQVVFYNFLNLVFILLYFNWDKNWIELDHLTKFTDESL